MMIGYTKSGEGGGLLYGFKAETGEILWEKDVPAEPVTAFSRVRRHKYSFRRGPDDHIWASIGQTLVRIDPHNIEVKPVGNASPAQLAFARHNVYIAGGGMLSQIEGVHTKDTIAPFPPENLSGADTKGNLKLTWEACMVEDVEGYNVYRSQDSLGDYNKINDELVADTSYSTSEGKSNTTYYYRVTAVDDAGNESDFSAAVTAVPVSDGEVVNHIPEFITNPDTAAKAGHYYNYEIKGKDEDGDSLRYDYEQLPPWLSFEMLGDTAAEISGIPGEDHVGEQYVILILKDKKDDDPVKQEFDIVVKSVTGLSDNRGSDILRVYPNPTDGQVTIGMYQYKKGSLEIYSVIGKKVREMELTRQRQTVNLSGNKPGVYLFRINVQGSPSPIVKRIVVR